MTERSKIFEDHYQEYCRQIEAVNLASIKDRLEIQVDNNIAQVVFFNQPYEISGHGIFDANNKKADYMTCVILSKYVLLCPAQLYLDADCKVLFQKQGEYYLDPESLAMTSVFGKKIN
jgi:hypothetical protein